MHIDQLPNEYAKYNPHLCKMAIMIWGVCLSIDCFENI